MNDFIFFTDASGDLKPALAREMDAVVLPVPFTLGGKAYEGYGDNREMEPEAFYAQLHEGKVCCPGAIEKATFIDSFTPYLEQEKDILYVGVSGGPGSPTSLAAEQAIAELKQQYPQRTIECVDTLQVGLGQGLAAFTAAMLRKEGQSLEEIAAWLRENAQSFCGWLMADNLNSLKGSGEMGGGAALAGALFGVKPLLHINSEGVPELRDKVRGRKACLDALAAHYAETALNPHHQTAFIGHADCLDDANYLAERIESLGVHRVEISLIGPGLVSRYGIGSVALFFMGNQR